MADSVRSLARRLVGLRTVVIAFVIWAAQIGVATPAALPDGRAYEMVSPVSKNGGDIVPDPGKTRAAAGGGAVSFASLTAFGGDVLGTGLITQYVSVRTGKPGSNGWSTHSVSPPQGRLSFVGAANGAAPMYAADFSDDLTKGVITSSSPLTNAPNVAGTGNLYLRDLLNTPGTFQLITAASIPVPPVSIATTRSYSPRLAGASADYGHLTFEAYPGLTPEAPSNQGVPKLYEWDHGTVRLAGVLPNGSAAPVSVPGQGISGLGLPSYAPNTLSRDGSRIIFTDTSTGSTGNDGKLYMRIDHSTTVQLNASEKPVPATPRPAMYQWATPDDHKVFFTSSEQLTTDDTDTTSDLYMYDVDAPSGSHLTRLSVDSESADNDGGNAIDGVLGGSDDGRYVYFISTRQLVAGARLFSGISSPYGIFLWHDGTLTFIGEVHESLDKDPLVGRKWALTPKVSRVTSDGRELVFATQSGVGLTGYDHGSCPNGGITNGCFQMYLYTADTGTLTCISCKQNGGPGTADSSPLLAAQNGIAARTYHLTRYVSDDGNRVFFTSGEALVPGDRNGAVLDVYEYDVPSGRLNLISTGRSTSDSLFLEASRTGSDVFFATRDQLVGWDIDDNYDVYDARVGGGFPEPLPVRACTGTVCRSQLTTVSANPVLGSTAISGRVGSHRKPPASKHCKRGRVRRRVHGSVKCVKPKHGKSRTGGHRNGGNR